MVLIEISYKYNERKIRCRPGLNVPRIRHRDDKNPNLGTAVVRSPTGKTARGNYRGKLDGDDFVIAKKAGYVLCCITQY